MGNNSRILLCGRKGTIRDAISKALKGENKVESLDLIEPEDLRNGFETDLLFVLLIGTEVTDSFFEMITRFECTKIALHTFDSEIVREDYIKKGFDEYISLFDFLDDSGPVIDGFIHQ